jgi:hypothetical protein
MNLDCPGFRLCQPNLMDDPWWNLILPQAAHQVNDWSVAKFPFENRREVPREAVFTPD